MGPFEDAMLSLLNQTQRDRLAPHVCVMSFLPGRTILVRGELLDRFYIVLDGQVEASVKTRRGLAAFSLTAGDLFGERSVVGEPVSEASVRACATGATVASVPERAFRELLQESAPLRTTFAERAAARRAVFLAATAPRPS